ncbi:hypothetical protein AGOR_G00033790 [Albula goreensis]|uniref:Uncharacterized protein n=1 Tax=Albula goreensis TaxID=1534307 RepID=A0A8T3DVH3_9TELE|nr:hypothetical protein AGOR_G00033790 [Albula goreensis]
MEPNYSLFQTRKERGLRCNQIACSIVHHHSWQRQAGAQRSADGSAVRLSGNEAEGLLLLTDSRGIPTLKHKVPAEAQSHADFPYPSVNR